MGLFLLPGELNPARRIRCQARAFLALRHARPARPATSDRKQSPEGGSRTLPSPRTSKKPVMTTPSPSKYTVLEQPRQHVPVRVTAQTLLGEDVVSLRIGAPHEVQPELGRGRATCPAVSRPCSIRRRPGRLSGAPGPRRRLAEGKDRPRRKKPGWKAPAGLPRLLRAAVVSRGLASIAILGPQKWRPGDKGDARLTR